MDSRGLSLILKVWLITLTTVLDVNSSECPISQVWGCRKGCNRQPPEQSLPVTFTEHSRCMRPSDWHDSSQLILSMAQWGRWYPHFTPEKNWGTERSGDLSNTTQQDSIHIFWFQSPVLCQQPYYHLHVHTDLLKSSSNWEKGFLGTQKILSSGDTFKHVCCWTAVGSRWRQNKYTDGRSLWKLRGHMWIR